MKLGTTLGFVLLAIGMAAAPLQAQMPNGNGYYGQTETWHSVLSPDDQQQFDKAYAKWVNDTRKNDRDDIDKDARKMQEIMACYNIPPSVPFDQIASNAAPGAYPGEYAQYPGSAYPGTYGSYGAAARLSPDDQSKFDKDYSKWLEAQRKGDQDDVADNARKMQEIMARYNIPGNVPFAAIATNGDAAGPNGSYASPQYARLSAKDQSDFDKDYRSWVKARQKRDMDDVDKNARKMEEIMARYNIPANVPFGQIASPGPAHP